MLKKRIIPCLDIKDGRIVKGTNFENLQDAGNPLEIAKKYVQDGADELVFLDISATIEKRKTLYSLVEQIAQHINIPFTIGGGIQSLSDAQQLFNCGADKISLNSAALINPILIQQIAAEYGSQSIVVAVDVKYIDAEWRVFSHGGKQPTNWQCNDWIKKVVDCGAGEILLTSISHDGLQAGFALTLLNEVNSLVRVPIIASGGAGNMLHFKEVFEQTKVQAALAASVFHYNKIHITQLKNYLKSHLIPIR